MVWRKLLVAVMFTFVLLAILSLFAYAASGPSVVQPVKKEPEKPQPKAGKVTPEEAAKYKCSEIETIGERIRCRLQLKEENEYDYLPEECRAQVNESREKCVANYKKSQQCWASLKDNERFDCAKKSFGLVGTVAAQKAQCDSLTGTERANCILQLRDRVDAVVKFRIYNLEEKAQQLMEKGVNAELVADFVALMEQKKQDYNSAATTAQKKAIVKEVQSSWKSFITTAKRQVKPV